ncbi:MAG: ABC transporter ATP-binding protein/permease [Anaeroplasmataceae bacterium]|nr:ABC transporter ATP-binding protein/permease [Anaeroplasmataceae bacterium]
MLEVKNLRKEYKSKNGAITKALDDVSLTFPETGMIFILGKSGSGKSTLLNVCGGLDKADSGEIIIKGKSSKEFSGQDFDSYRNTYVGFVFQEYNILDEFSVEENIGLALELQNKKRDKAIVDKILSDVDMTNFATRKPNTLSGGQKQRVAIARALVKEPQIIMADEPTGALDSKTGQQVFDTLKKLSKEKLVIVVSHDRDFAEQYGDRIIELKDGKILSDQTRMEMDENEKNVRYFGTDVVCVTNGAEITDDDLQSIKKFLKRSGGSAVISTSRTQIVQMKEERPELDVGSFENIKEQPKSKTYEQQKMIRSHLPVKHAVKMGANSLKSKPIRLFFTIFLSIMAFILFGLASTLMLFDGKQTTVQTFVDSDEQYMILSKGYYGRYTQYLDDVIEYQSKNEEIQETRYTIEEYKNFSEKYPGAIAVSSFSNRIESIRLGQYGNQYYKETIEGVILANDSIEMIYGEQPKTSDEIAISDYVLNCILSPKTRFMDANNTEISITKVEELLYSEQNKIKLNIGYKEYKVVGVFKLDTPSSEFDGLKQAADNDTQFVGDNKLKEKWKNYLEDSLLPTIMVSEAFMEANSSNNNYFGVEEYFSYTMGDLKIWIKSEDNWAGGIEFVSKLEGEKKLAVYDLSGKPVASLSNNSVALHISRLAYLYSQAYQRYVEEINNSYEEQEKLEALYNDLKVQFEKDNLLIDKYFDKQRYEDVKQQWELDFKNAKDQAEAWGEEFDEDAYREYFPYPLPLDKYEWGDEYKYYVPDDDYRNALEAYRTFVYETSGTLSRYKAPIYYARMEAETEFRKNNPEPQYPENPTGAELDAYHKLHNEWEQKYWKVINEAQNNADPIAKLSNIYSSTMTSNQIFSLFKELEALFEDLYKVEVGIYNSYNPQFSPVKVQGVFFDNISDNTAYLSNDLYEKYYVSNGSSRYWYEYITKYEEPKNSYIERIYIPYQHNSASVEELVKMTYTRANDDSTTVIQNSQMEQLSMFIELAETLGTAFLIAGIVLALFAFLLMFNFISVSISTKKKEIGILRAIGARTLDVYKIFLAESLIIAVICMVIAIGGAWGLCILLNSILTSETFIVVSVFSFGPLSALCIVGIALITAIISTVIPVAIYSRKPPIASIRAL